MIQRIAAFIITYERPAAVSVMVDKLLLQTRPPETILVIDNSSSLQTKELIHSLNDSRIRYHRVGHNSGPAGAAQIGLKLLADEGYGWICWCDDDDPPETPTSFDDIFKILGEGNFQDREVGVIGKAGGKINRTTGRTTSFRNDELRGIVEADYIAGNKMMIVSSNVVKNDILPEAKLFFGFEELEFCLRIKEKGFKILFNGSKLRERRMIGGKSHGSYRWHGQSIGDTDKLWRQYYSTRNMLYVLKVNGLWFALILNITKALSKSIYGFRYGLKYGSKNFRIQTLALFHFIGGRFGQTNLSGILERRKS